MPRPSILHIGASHQRLWRYINITYYLYNEVLSTQNHRIEIGSGLTALIVVFLGWEDVCVSKVAPLWTPVLRALALSTAAFTMECERGNVEIHTSSHPLKKTTKKERLSRSFNALYDVGFEYVEYFVYIVFCVDV